MTTRRSRGDGGIHWDESRQRWIATASLGFRADGTRIVKKRSARTKTAAKDKLKEIIRDYEDGLAIAPHAYSVADAVTYWLAHGLNGRSQDTVDNYRTLADKHIVPALGPRKLRELSVEDIDKWLARKAKTLSTRTLRLIHSLLNRAVKNAQARDKVKRNVVGLVEIPTGQDGRPSKSLNLDQAEAVLVAAEWSRLHAYVVLSLLTGARTEELRALEWTHVVAYEEKRKAWLPVTEIGWSHERFGIYVWRSVREGGDTKTVKSRRTLGLPVRCFEALELHQTLQTTERETAGKNWKEHGLVFASQLGTPLDSHNVRRNFRQVAKRAGLVAADWTPRELRHSFVSLLSDDGVPLERISRLVGHSGTTVTETVYRHQIRPVMDDGATAMDRIFSDEGGDAA
ncbi:site-specific integrase [Fodinicola feengrottensis]|uniref:Site-specific integrase n=1 Tax=Fodinicola feengrottensis TaxID=435914 RepID=A0ABP4TMH6_9ACTN